MIVKISLWKYHICFFYYVDLHWQRSGTMFKFIPQFVEEAKLMMHNLTRFLQHKYSKSIDRCRTEEVLEWLFGNE